MRRMEYCTKVLLGMQVATVAHVAVVLRSRFYLIGHQVYIRQSLTRHLFIKP